MNAEERRAKHIAASLKWRNENWQYWKLQKRALSARESYKAHRRAKYREKMQRLREVEGYVQPKRGRPALYSPTTALQRRRETSRKWAIAHRSREKLSGMNKYLHEQTSETSSAESDRCSH